MPTDDQAGAEHPAAAESPPHHGLGGEGHAHGPGQEQRRQGLARLRGIAPAHALHEQRDVGLDPEEDAADQEVADDRGRIDRPDHQVHRQDRVFGPVLPEHEADQEHDRQSQQDEARRHAQARPVQDDQQERREPRGEQPGAGPVDRGHLACSTRSWTYQASMA